MFFVGFHPQRFTWPPEVVMKAVQTDGSALMFASEELQRDKDALKRVGICTDNHSSPSSMFL